MSLTSRSFSFFGFDSPETVYRLTDTEKNMLRQLHPTLRQPWLDTLNKKYMTSPSSTPAQPIEEKKEEKKEEGPVTAEAVPSFITPDSHFLRYLKTYPHIQTIPGASTLPDTINVHDPDPEKWVPYKFVGFCLTRLDEQKAPLSFAVGGIVSSFLTGKDPDIMAKRNNRFFPIIDIDLITEASEAQIRSAFEKKDIAPALPEKTSISPLKESYIKGTYSITASLPENKMTYKIQIKQSESFRKDSYGNYIHRDPLWEDSKSRDFASGAAYFNKEGNILMPFPDTIHSFVQGVTIVIDKEAAELKEEKTVELRSFTQDFKRALRAILQDAKGFSLPPSTRAAISTTLNRLRVRLEKEEKVDENKEQENLARSINIFMQDKIFSRQNAPELFAAFDQHGALEMLYPSFPWAAAYRGEGHAFINKNVISQYSYTQEIYASLILLSDKDLLTALQDVHNKDSLTVLKRIIANNKLYQTCFNDYTKYAVSQLKNAHSEDDILFSLFCKHAEALRTAYIPLEASSSKKAPPIVADAAYKPALSYATSSEEVKTGAGVGVGAGIGPSADAKASQTPGYIVKNTRGYCIFHTACQFGRKSEASLLLQKIEEMSGGKQTIAYQNYLTRADKDGFTPLHAAAKEGHHHIVLLLIECAAAAFGEETSDFKNFINSRNHHGFTPIHAACDNIGWKKSQRPISREAEQNYATTARILLEKGRANPLINNNRGHIAITSMPQTPAWIDLFKPYIEKAKVDSEQSLSFSSR